MHRIQRSGVVLLLTGAAACSAPQPERMTYPTTRTGDQVDTYHGVSVADPYRWLEDDTSAETAAWVEAQNKVTFAHLESIPFRAALTARLEQLYNYPKFGEPFRRGTTYFFFEERRPAEPVGGLPADRARRRARGAARSQRALARWHHQAEHLRGVEGRPPRRLRPERGRVRLADLQGARRDHPAAAHRFGRVGEGVGGGVGRRRVLLQPVSGAREGQGADHQERRPPGVLPSPGDAAVGRRAGLLGSGQPRALPHRGDHRGRALPDPHRLGSRQGQEGQRRLLPRPGQPGSRLHADRRRDRRRHLQRHRQRRRSVPGPHRSRRAERPRRPVRPEDPGPERLEGRAAGASRAARQRRHRRRQALRHLPEGRHLARLRLRSRRPARARDRAARPGRGVGARRPRRRRRGVLHLHLVQLPADDLQVRRRDQGLGAVPRGDDSRVQRRRLRGAAGLRAQQGRHQGADVPDLQEGPGAERRRTRP